MSQKSFIFDREVIVGLGGRILQGVFLLLAVALGVLVSFLIYREFVLAASRLNLAERGPGGAFLASPFTMGVVATGLGLGSVMLCVLAASLLVAGLYGLAMVRWPNGERLSWPQAVAYTMRSIFGRDTVLLVIDGEEWNKLPSSEEDKCRVKLWGGPAWLVIYPGRVVALHYRGQLTRIESAGTVMIDPAEEIKAILPLGGKSNSQELENVLTKDKIALRLKVAHGAQIEPAEDTKKRLDEAVNTANLELREARRSNTQNETEATRQSMEKATQALEKAKKSRSELENDRLIGDDSGHCYENILRKIAMGSPNIWEAFKGSVGSNLRDVILTETFEKLFELKGDHEAVDPRIDKRKIKEIEDSVKKNAQKPKLNDGLILKFVDIAEVAFHEELRRKINEEVETQIDERIQQTKARIEEFKAKGRIVEARAKAQARILEGQGEGESRAAEIRELLRELRRDGLLSQDQVSRAVIELIGTKTSVKELERLVRASAVGSKTTSYDKTNGHNGVE